MGQRHGRRVRQGPPGCPECVMPDLLARRGPELKRSCRLEAEQAGSPACIPRTCRVRSSSRSNGSSRLSGSAPGAPSPAEPQDRSMAAAAWCVPWGGVGARGGGVLHLLAPAASSGRPAAGANPRRVSHAQHVEQEPQFASGSSGRGLAASTWICQHPQCKQASGQPHSPCHMAIAVCDSRHEASRSSCGVLNSHLYALGGFPARSNGCCRSWPLGPGCGSVGRSGWGGRGGALQAGWAASIGARPYLPPEIRQLWAALDNWAAAAGAEAAGERCNSPAGVNGFPLLFRRAAPPALRQSRERG